MDLPIDDTFDKVSLDHDNGNIIFHSEDGKHIIWKVYRCDRSPNGGHLLRIESYPCAASLRKDTTASPCRHPHPVSNTKKRSNPNSLDSLRPAKKDRLSPDDIANRLFESLRSQIDRWSRTRPFIVQRLPEIESQLREYKAQGLSPQGLREALDHISVSHTRQQDDHRVLIACLDHLCQCLDLCVLETAESNAGNREVLSKELERVRWRHRIVNTAVDCGWDEPLALVLLSIMADSNTTFTYLVKTNAENKSKAIQKFLSLVKPKLDKQEVWYLNPITFVTWCFNLEEVDHPVATLGGSTNIRTLLGLDAFRMQDVRPCLTIQNRLIRYMSDKGSPVRRLTCNDESISGALALGVPLQTQESQGHLVRHRDNSFKQPALPIQNRRGGEDQPKALDLNISLNLTAAEILETIPPDTTPDLHSNPNQAATGFGQLPSPISQVTNPRIMSRTLDESRTRWTARGYLERRDEVISCVSSDDGASPCTAAPVPGASPHFQTAGEESAQEPTQSSPRSSPPYPQCIEYQNELHTDFNDPLRQDRQGSFTRGSMDNGVNPRQLLSGAASSPGRSTPADDNEVGQRCALNQMSIFPSDLMAESSQSGIEEQFNTNVEYLLDRTDIQLGWEFPDF